MVKVTMDVSIIERNKNIIRMDPSMGQKIIFGHSAATNKEIEQIKKEIGGLVRT
jgi:hypothetical protein